VSPYPSEELTITLSQRDKRLLKLRAKAQRTTMRAIVRGLVRDAVAPATRQESREAAVVR